MLTVDETVYEVVVVGGGPAGAERRLGTVYKFEGGADGVALTA